MQIMIKWACCGTFYISFTNHRRIIKASGRAAMVVMVLHQAARFIDAQRSGGKKKTKPQNLCFVSFAILVHLPLSKSLWWFHVSQIINLGSIITFPQSALISSPPKRLSPLLSLNAETPCSLTILYIPHFSPPVHSPQSFFFFFFCRARFKMSSSALASSHPSHPHFHLHPEAPREACFCIVSVLAAAVPVLVHCDTGSKGGQRSALKRHTSHPRTRFSCAGKRRRVHA